MARDTPSGLHPVEQVRAGALGAPDPGLEIGCRVIADLLVWSILCIGSLFISALCPRI